MNGGESSTAAFSVLSEDGEKGTNGHSASSSSSLLLSPRSFSASSSRPSIPILTGLRGVLAVWILLHNSARAGDPDIIASWLVTSGSTAVSAFFCLSGFIMVSQPDAATAQHRQSLRQLPALRA